MTESIIAYNPNARRWWGRFFIEVPEDVQRRLAISRAAQGLAHQLAPLDPEANREILSQVADLLGVKEE